ncbi:MAG: glycoside hydrolase family 130 protein [Planctomycetes bacterium]|nr:glycoside hydrolase family 130 protein [Planctomycetota bacterium]
MSAQAKPVPARLTSAACIRRHPGNPVLSAKDVPYAANLVFNAGLVKHRGRYVTVFRNDFGSTAQDFEDFNQGRRTAYPQLRTNLGFATSPDGITWTVEGKPLPDSDPATFARLAGLDPKEVCRVYDPRITVIDGKPYLCLALDTHHGVRGVIAETDDELRNWKVLHITVPDNRNMVLFPHKVGGNFVRLERPFPVYSRGRDRFDIWLGRSPDLRYWGDHALVLGVEDVPFADDKLGPAAPPVLTDRGWLVVFHAVDRDDSRGKNGWEKAWKKRYTAGIMLLDRDDPSKVIGMSKQPLIAPEAPYEVAGGFRDHVIFPCGLIVEPSGEAKIWYGAGDAVIGLATCHVDQLIALCTSPR